MLERDNIRREPASSAPPSFGEIGGICVSKVGLALPLVQSLRAATGSANNILSPTRQRPRVLPLKTFDIDTMPLRHRGRLPRPYAAQPAPASDTRGMLRRRRHDSHAALRAILPRRCHGARYEFEAFADMSRHKARHCQMLFVTGRQCRFAHAATIARLMNIDILHAATSRACQDKRSSASCCRHATQS